MSAVFISYRRSDSLPLTGRMYDQLVAVLGPDAVFRDIDTLEPGAHFPSVLAAKLSRCRVTLVIIGPTWATTTDDSGTRRLYNPQDFVRLEVAASLRRGIPVIPVLVDGATLPAQKDLPKQLYPLRDRQIVHVRPDPDFDSDLDRLIATLKGLLAGASSEPSPIAPVEEPSAKSEAPPTVDERVALIGVDQAFPRIAERAAKERPIILTGPPGIGKTATTRRLTQWYSPAVVIDAREELYELSLVEAVGKQYPEELYNDEKGVPFVSLAFPAQHRRAIDLLVKKKAVVILDGPGESAYPRDPLAEIELARRLVKDLSDRGVLAIVATRNEAFWADLDPIPLRGLTPEITQKLLIRELANRSIGVELEDLTATPEEAAAVEQLVKRGHPGDVVAAARDATLAGLPKPRPSGSGGLLNSLRRLVEAVLGDPVTPRPPKAEGGPTAWGVLVIVCVGLLLLSTLSLIGSYESKSTLWERMFYGLPKRPADVPPLPAVATKVSPGPGLLVEFTRAFLIIICLMLVVIGRFFRDELVALVPYAPWSDVGPRTLGLRSVFRLVFLGLTVWLAVSTTIHCLRTGPRTLWMCNGNPFLQEQLNQGDPAVLQALRDKDPADRDKMNGEPVPGTPLYDEYLQQCVVPYRIYLVYAIIMFAVVGPTVLTTCFYAICLSLWTHFNLQPRRIEEVADDAGPQEAENRLRFYKTTYTRNIDKYLILLLLLLGGWSFHLWWDRYNLIDTAADHTTHIIVVALLAWLSLFTALLLPYQILVRETGKQFPEGEPRDSFEKRHGWFRFFARAVGKSAYFWLCVVPLIGSAAWFATAMLAGWER